MYIFPHIPCFLQHVRTLLISWAFKSICMQATSLPAHSAEGARVLETLSCLAHVVQPLLDRLNVWSIPVGKCTIRRHVGALLVLQPIMTQSSDPASQYCQGEPRPFSNPGTGTKTQHRYGQKSTSTLYVHAKHGHGILDRSHKAVQRMRI